MTRREKAAPIMWWVLGAPDPEMERIEGLLRHAGQSVAYACQADGSRVHPGAAYRFHHLRYPGGAEVTAGPRVVLVECGPEQPAIWCADREVLRIDHHRPGDPGWGLCCDEFLAGSSIGQVITLLAGLDTPLPDGWDVVAEARAAPHATATPDEWEWRNRWVRTLGINWVGPSRRLGFFRHEWGWVVCWPTWRKEAGRVARWPRVVRVPNDLVIAAASDHCPADAYRDCCLGVHPAAFAAWRVRVRAAHQGRPEVEVEADIDAAAEALRAAPRLELAPGVEVADLRGQSIPELPEAGLREGIAFLATPRPSPDGRQKVVLQAASPDHLDEWPTWARAQGLVDLYGGDPARGFAGGYVAEMGQ